MMPAYEIVDVELFDMVEELYPGWGVWACEAHLDDGSRITGTIQSDGIGWDAASFEADED